MPIAAMNPGTEAVPYASLANAAEALRLFIKDLGLGAPVEVRRDPDNDDLGEGIGGGRYAFVLSTSRGSCSVDMPGCDPAVTRESRPFYSPRLYVSGPSWLWGFGLARALDYLEPGHEEGA